MKQKPIEDRFYNARNDPSLVVIEGFHPLKHAIRFGAELLEVVSPDLQELAALQADARQAQRGYDEQLGRLENIYLQRDAALEGRDLSFQVMDPPNLPSSPLPTPRKDLLMLPALGMLLGVSASGAVLFSLTRLDDSIRLPGEARQVGAPVLAVVPELGRRRVSSWPKHFVRLVVAASRGLIGNLR